VRWLILLVPSAIYFVSYFHRIAPAVVAADLMRAFSITAASLGSLAAIYPYVFVVMALVGGSLADTLGPRWTLTLGGLAMGAGALVFGLAPTFSIAYAGRLLVGLGGSVVLVSLLSLAAAWFRPDEFATVSGLSQTIGNIGGLVAASPLALLVEAVGWRTSFVLIGVATLLLAVAAILAVRDRPEAMGLPPANPAGGTRTAPRLGEVLRGIPEVVRNPRSWPPVLAAGGVYSTLLVVQALWGVPYLTQTYGLARVEAAGFTSLLAVGIIVGGPLVGWISDRWLGRRRLPYVVFAAIYVACWVPLVAPSLAPAQALLGPFFFAMGFAASGLVLVWSCAREVNDPARVGVVIGFCNVPIFLLFAIMQWLTGVVLDAKWDGAVVGGLRVYPAVAYQTAFGLCLAVGVLSLIMAALVTETRCRSVWTPVATRS
jgi:sugar phosphate permease